MVHDEDLIFIEYTIIMTSFHTQVLKWSRRLLGKRLFCQIMKASFYGQFVAGEDQVAIRPLVNNNRKYGVKSILDYSVEEDISSKDAKEAEMKWALIKQLCYFLLVHLEQLTVQ